MQETMQQPVGSRQEAAEPMLYDADASQRIPFEKEINGELVPVAFVLGSQTDKALKEYDRLCDRRLESIDAKEAGERNAMTSKDRSDDAAKWLFRDRAESCEGFGDEGEPIPENWVDYIDDVDQIDVINQAYLATGEVPRPPAKPGTRLPWNYKTAGAEKVISIRALFNGYELKLDHRRDNAHSAEQLAEFKSLSSSAALVGGARFGKAELLILSKAERFGALYDSVGYQASGYAGRVPLHHKRKVVEIDFAGGLELVVKKPGGSPN